MITQCVLLLSCVLITSGAREKFFRKDYTYLDATQSFYKIQTIHKNWQNAKTNCELEGATLYYPHDEDEDAAVVSFWNATQNEDFIWIYVGISTPVAQEIFETVDGLPLEDIYDKWAPGEPNIYYGTEECVSLKRVNGSGRLYYDKCDKPLRYICKKTEASLRWNDLCDIPDPEYTYYEKTGRCYKLHLTPKNWTSSYVTCGKEQSRLAVINSDTEANIFVDIIKNSPKDLIDGDHLKDAIHMGFKYRKGSYIGTDIRNSGYSKWADGLPQNRGDKACGSMLYDGLLSFVSCDDKAFFICEHEIRQLQAFIDYKFGDDK